MNNIDVVIPCHNCDSSLIRAVDSVRENSEFIRKLILIENGSTDNTLEIIKSISIAGVDVIYKDIGNANGNIARNKGLFLSESDYIIFLDADDALTKNRVQNDISIIFNHSPDVVVNDYEKVSLDGAYTRHRVSVSNDKNGWFSTLADTSISITSAITYRRESLLSIGSWNNEQSSSQEAELMFRLLKGNCNLYITNKPLAYIHETEGSLTKKRVKIVRYNNLMLRLAIFNYVALMEDYPKELMNKISLSLIKRFLLLYEVDADRGLLLIKEYQRIFFLQSTMKSKFLFFLFTSYPIRTLICKYRKYAKKIEQEIILLIGLLWFFPLKSLTQLIFPQFNIPAISLTLVTITLQVVFIALFIRKILSSKFSAFEMIPSIFFIYTLILIVIYGFFNYLPAYVGGVSYYSYYILIILNWIVYFILGTYMHQSLIEKSTKYSLVIIAIFCVDIITLAITNDSGFRVDFKSFEYTPSYIQLADAFALSCFILLANIRQFKFVALLFISSSIVLFLLGSRSSLIVYVLVVSLFMFRTYKSYSLLFVFVVVGTLISFGTVLLNEFESNSRYMILLSSYSDDASYLGRAEMLSRGLYAIKQNWIVGDLGGQINILDNGSERWGTYIHNILAYWRQFGVVGWISIVLFVGLVVLNAVNSFFKMKESVFSGFFFMCSLYCVMLLLFFRSFNFPYFYFCLGMIVNLNHKAYKN